MNRIPLPAAVILVIALAVGTALVPGGRVALLDTEHGSAAPVSDDRGINHHRR